MLPFAYLGAFHDYRGRFIVEILLLLPLVLPPTIVGLYILQLLGRYGPLSLLSTTFIFSLSGSILATTIILFPIMYQGLKVAFFSVQSELIYVARLYVSRPISLLYHVILPVSWQMVLATLLLSFCRAIGEFGASLMVAGYIPGNTDTLSNAIYFAVQSGDNGLALRLSFITIGLGLLVLLLIFLLNSRQKVKF
jgi:molybdate transport system permease protein